MEELRDLFDELEQYHPKIIDHIISMNLSRDNSTDSNIEIATWYGTSDYVKSKLDETEAEIFDRIVEKIDLIHEKIFIEDVVTAYLRPHFITRNFVHYPDTSSKNSHSHILFFDCSAIHNSNKKK